MERHISEKLTNYSIPKKPEEAIKKPAANDDIFSRLMELSNTPKDSPSSNIGPVEPRKRKFEEHNNQDWINKYDQPLPQEILSKCTLFTCGVCNVKLSSDVVSRTHYQGKPHEKEVDKALKEYSQRTGEATPKKRKIEIASITVDSSVESFLNVERLANWQKAYLETWDGPLPEALLKLSRPSRCELCMVDFTSQKAAESHMDGRNHDKKVVQWLKEYCAATNHQMPVKKAPAGDLEEKWCNHCAVTLSSPVMAKAHFSGKAHLNRVKSGLVKGDGSRFGIGVAHQKQGGYQAPQTPVETDDDQIAAALRRAREDSELGAGDGWEMKSEAFWANVAQIATNKAPQGGANYKGRYDSVSKSASKKKDALNASGAFVCVPCGVNLGSQCTLDQHNQGKKHKAHVMNGGAKLPQTQLTCDLCNISVTSEALLEAHKNGQKHQKKAQAGQGGQVGQAGQEGQGGLAGQDIAKLNSRMANADFWCEVCNIFTNTQEIMDIHKAGKQHLKKASKSPAAESNFRCDLCKVSTTNADNLQAHMIGSKHQSVARKLGMMINQPAVTVNQSSSAVEPDTANQPEVVASGQ